jgi:hypothetical protein
MRWWGVRFRLGHRYSPRALVRWSTWRGCLHFMRHAWR